jgi:uncharacterized protein YkwD
MLKSLLLLTILVTVTIAVLQDSYAGSNENEIFSPLEGAIPDEWMQVDESIVIRQRLVEVSLDRISPDQQEIVLNLFDGEKVAAVRNHTEIAIGKGFAWIGSAAYRQTSAVVLVVEDQKMSGSVRMPETIYQIRPVENRIHLIRQVRVSPGPEGFLTLQDAATPESEVTAIVNEERQIHQLHPLISDPALARAAEAHSIDMGQQNYFSHTSLDGTQFSRRITNAGYEWNTCGENIAAGYSTPEAVVNAWMLSSGHRANILSRTFCDIGVGYAYISGSYYRNYWTQDFGRKRDVWACSPIPNFTITAAAGIGGSINPAETIEVLAGESIRFDIIPDAGFRIADVLVNGISVGPRDSYLFENVSSNQTIEAVFAKKSFSWIPLLLLEQ